MKRKVKNPILPGFYPDPSICRVGEEYYMVNSTFAYFPGIPVFHSKNLADWEQIGSVLTRNTQIPLEGCGHSEGIYAPTIRYYEGLFFVIATNVSGGGNFIVMAEDPAGPWTEPIFLGEQAKGIDPSLFFDDDGSCWYVGQRERTGGGDYFGDCEIWMRKLDLKKVIQSAREEWKLTVQEEFSDWENSGQENAQIGGEKDLRGREFFSGEDTVLSYGFARKAVWAEGPHLYKKDGYYYLLHAEMGTELNHCVAVARSRNLTGPYEYSRTNPILTHRHLGKNYPVTCVGHADLVDDGHGNWYMVMLASRPTNGYTLMGRETFLAKVIWEEEWPVVNPGVGRLEPEVELMHEKQLEQNRVQECAQTSEQTEDLKKEMQQKQRPEEIWGLEKDERIRNCGWKHGFLTLRNPAPGTIQMINEDGTASGGWNCFRLAMKKETAKDTGSPSYLALRQQHKAFAVQVKLSLHAEKEEDCAGLVYMQSNKAHLRMECFEREGCMGIRLIKCQNGEDILMAERVLGKRNFDAEIWLKIEVRDLQAVFLWKTEEIQEWRTLNNRVDLKFMSTESAGGFVGCTVGMYASANGGKSSGYGEFRDFHQMKVPSPL